LGSYGYDLTGADLSLIEDILNDVFDANYGTGSGWSSGTGWGDSSGFSSTDAFVPTNEPTNPPTNEPTEIVMDSGDCEDMWEFCGDLAAEGRCDHADNSTQAEMHAECPVSCGLCTETTATAARSLKLQSSKPANARLSEEFNVALQRMKSVSSQRKERSNTHRSSPAEKGPPSSRGTNARHSEESRAASQRTPHAKSGRESPTANLLRELTDGMTERDLVELLGSLRHNH